MKEELLHMVPRAVIPFFKGVLSTIVVFTLGNVLMYAMRSPVSVCTCAAYHDEMLDPLRIGTPRTLGNADFLRLLTFEANLLQNSISSPFPFVLLSMGNSAMKEMYQSWYCNTAHMKEVHERTLIIMSGEEAKVRRMPAISTSLLSTPWAF
jgi:hypothetical protein